MNSKFHAILQCVVLKSGFLAVLDHCACGTITCPHCCRVVIKKRWRKILALTDFIFAEISSLFDWNLLGFSVRTALSLISIGVLSVLFATLSFSASSLLSSPSSSSSFPSSSSTATVPLLRTAVDRELRPVADTLPMPIPMLKPTPMVMSTVLTLSATPWVG